MFSTYPKGKSKPGKEVKPRSERLDSSYYGRAMLGQSEETRTRNLLRSDYGKKPQKEDAINPPIRVSPRRTIISTQGGLGRVL